MNRITGSELEPYLPFIEEAAIEARHATCHNAKCGAIIVNDGIIGRGHNGPAFDDEANRTCDNEYDLSIKPKYDKTCCIHAEWAADIDALKNNSDKIDGSTLIFMRVDDEGNYTDAGDPYCTTCSRFTLATGVGRFALWNADGLDVYDTGEYNRKSYAYFAATAS